jgi:hypothetical protein
MELLFEDIRERDMDCLFIEEFNVNNDFLIKLFNNHIKDLNKINQITAKHSVVDSQYGETDIFVDVKTDEYKLILLIENKIDALFQPQQSERYNIRKNNIINENNEIIVYTVLFAPEKYISGHKESSNFDICVTYEEIMKFFDSNETKRDKYKAKIIGMAIEQAKRGYNIKEDIRVTNFWRNYWNYLQSNYPNIIMKEPNIKPFDADWPLMYLNWLPKYWEIHHKLSKGFIDLQTNFDENKILVFKDINKEINIAKTNKSYSLRILVPKIDRLKDFFIQINNINICFEKIKLFDDIKTICNGI